MCGRFAEDNRNVGDLRKKILGGKHPGSTGCLKKFNRNINTLEPEIFT